MNKIDYLQITSNIAATMSRAGDPLSEDQQTILAGSLAVYLSQTPVGMQLVPVEPTIEMREAFHEAHERWERGVGDSPDYQWKAMLKAARGES